MSGKAPLLGRLRLSTITIRAPEILCTFCGPKPGYGYDVPQRYHYKNWANTLPPAGNGFPVNGICSYCCATGIMPIPLSEIL